MVTTPVRQIAVHKKCQAKSIKKAALVAYWSSGIRVTTPLCLLLPKTLGITQNLLAKGKRLFQFLSSVLICLAIRVPLMIMVPST